MLELLHPADLEEEGRCQHHCVAGYAWQVASRRCSIWSLRVNRSGSLRRVLTLQVRPPGIIVQCRGRGNRAPTKEEREFVRFWSEENGLRVSGS